MISHASREGVRKICLIKQPTGFVESPGHEGIVYQALSEARPLARRAFIIARPLRVFILARKPWRRLRFKTLGWNVLFMISVFDFS
jgi:hypothetical protein